MARPLTHRTKDGTVLTRPPRVEKAIDAALAQGEVTRLARARRWDQQDPDHLPLEAVLHLVREAHRAGRNRARDRLLEVLLRRCEQVLKRTVPSRPRGDDIRAETLGELAERVALGLTRGGEAELDFLECCFLQGLAAIRASVARKFQARDRLEKAPRREGGEPPAAKDDDIMTSADVHANLARADAPQEHAARLADVARAMDELPKEERETLVMTQLLHYDVDQAAAALGVDRRTIFNRRDRAIARLREHEGDDT